MDERLDAKAWAAITANPWDFVVVVDRSLRYRFINRTAAGYQQADLIGKLTPMHFMPDDDKDRVKAILESVVNTGEPQRYQVHIPVLNAWFETCVLARRDDDGEVLDLILQTRDITDLRRVESSLREANQELRAHHERLDQLVAQRTAELEAANTRLARLARTDELTGLANRRATMDRLDREAERLRRYGGSLGLLMIDLDHFKRINDQYGHVFGDSVLTHVATILLRAVRAVDLCGRYGGEEFVVVMPNTTHSGAQHVAGRILLGIANSPYIADEVAVSITVSIGATVFSPGPDATEMIRAVDTAMYAAKDAGRNRVFMAKEEPATTE